MKSCQSACMWIHVRCGGASGLSSKSELQLQSCRIRTQSASGESRLAHGRYAPEREGTGRTPHARFGLSLTISVIRMRTFHRIAHRNPASPATCVRCLSSARSCNRSLMTVAKMMFGFGDIQSPRPETVSVMEEIVRDYVQEMVRETVSWHRLRIPH